MRLLLGMILDVDMKKLKVSLILLLLVSLISTTYAADGYKCEPKHVYKLMDNGTLKEITDDRGYLFSSNRRKYHSSSKSKFFYVNNRTGKVSGGMPWGFDIWNKQLNRVKIIEEGVGDNRFRSVFYDQDPRPNGIKEDIYTFYMPFRDSSGPFLITGQGFYDYIRTGNCSRI